MEASSIRVDRLKRTVAPHGLTGAELKRLNGALHLMRRRIKVEGSELWWLTTLKDATRNEIASIQKRITKLQSAQGLYCYSAWVFETRPKLHAHIVFVGNSEIAAALERSAICRGCKIEPVLDPDGLSKSYLVKERTPQAGYRRSDLGGRIRGAHRVEGGGDRVRLSRELERDAIEDGLVQEWRHTNAKRSPERKRRKLQRLYPKKAPSLSGQMLLFPELSKPVARLQAFGGGYVPRAVAAEIEFRCRQLGLSQRQLASRVGRSRGQISNAIRGHDPISGLVVNRLRDVLLRTPVAPNNPAKTTKMPSLAINRVLDARLIPAKVWPWWQRGLAWSPRQVLTAAGSFDYSRSRSIHASTARVSKAVCQPIHDPDPNSGNGALNRLRDVLLAAKDQ